MYKNTPRFSSSSEQQRPKKHENPILCVFFDSLAPARHLN